MYEALSARLALRTESQMVCAQGGGGGYPTFKRPENQTRGIFNRRAGVLPCQHHNLTFAKSGLDYTYKTKAVQRKHRLSLLLSLPHI